jgi:hypothetical protein
MPPILRALDQKEQRPAQRNRYHPERRAALNRTNRAADGTQHIDLAGDPGADRQVGRHANQFRVEFLCSWKYFLSRAMNKSIDVTPPLE